MGHLTEANFIAAQDSSAARGPAPQADVTEPERRRYLLVGLLTCGACGRRMDRNLAVDILPRLPALHYLLAGGQPARRRRTRGGADARTQASPESVITYLRDRGITLTYDPAEGTLRAGTAKTTIRKAS